MISSHSENKIFKIVTVVIILIFISTVALDQYYESLFQSKWDQLTEKYVLVNGRIDTISIDSNSRPHTIYSYYHKNKKIIDTINHVQYPKRIEDMKDTAVLNQLKTFQFPVLVSLIDTKFVYPLLMPNDFERLDLKFPDSLKYNYQRFISYSNYSRRNSSKKKK